MPTRSGPGSLLRVFVGESDRRDGKPLYEWLLACAHDEGLAGATVIRGCAGFGAHSVMHRAKVLRLSDDLPMVVEIADSREKIERFLRVIDEAITEGIAVVEPVTIHVYRRQSGEPDAAQ
jgi:PII-like signaling protein